jgi:hypothetical protein
MLSRVDIAKIRAELAELQKARDDCNASGIRKLIEAWIHARKKKLVSENDAPIAGGLLRHIAAAESTGAALIQPGAAAAIAYGNEGVAEAGVRSATERLLFSARLCPR